jgi:hypothetical protein
MADLKRILIPLGFLALPLAPLALVHAASEPVKGDQPLAELDANPLNAKVPPEVRVKDLNKRPERFSGQIVSVKGNVGRIESPNAFILDGAGLFNNKILVIVEEPAAPPMSGTRAQQAGMAAPVIREKQQLELQGKLVQVSMAQIQERYLPKIDPQLKAEFDGVMPVLVVPPVGIKKRSAK